MFFKMKKFQLRLVLSGLLWFVAGPGVADPAQHVYNLDQVIEQALANNPELAIMQQRIEQADAQLGQALAGFYPQIKTSLSYQYSNNPAQAFSMLIAERRLNFGGTNFNNPGFVEDYRPQVSATYALFRGGQDYYQKQAAELGIEATELERSATRNRLLNNVTAAYYGELAAIAAHNITQRAIETVERELQQSQLRYDAGALLKSEVLSLQVQLADARETGIQTANAIEMAQNMLKTLLGLSVNEPFAIDQAQVAPLPQPAGQYDTLLDKALSSHPELKAAEKRVEIAEKQLAIAQAAFLPRADAYVNYGSDSKNLTYSSNRDNVTTGVIVDLDLFNGFATREKLKKTESELHAAKEIARQTRLQVENQLKTAQLKLQEALNRAEISAMAVQAAEEAFRLVNEQRQAGVVTVTRYLEAEVARDKAHTRQISSRYDALRADAELKQAIGFWQ